MLPRLAWMQLPRDDFTLRSVPDQYCEEPPENRYIDLSSEELRA